MPGLARDEVHCPYCRIRLSHLSFRDRISHKLRCHEAFVRWVRMKQEEEENGQN